MKKDLKKELLKYTSAAAAVLGGTTAQGQYQYTDIPDTTVDVNAGFYTIDLDQDGTGDFKLVQYVDTGAAGNTSAVLIQPFDNAPGLVVGTEVNQYNYPFKMQSTAIVDVNSTFFGMGGQHQTGYLAFEVDGQSYPNSNWVGPVEDGFLGLVLFKNSQPHYGWCRLNVGEDSKSFTVKDFSINLTPDSAIIVGYELLDVAENPLQAVNFAVTGNEITFRIPEVDQNLNVKLIDLTGKVLTKGVVSSESPVLNIGELPTAIYILEMESHGLVRREKVWVY